MPEVSGLAAILQQDANARWSRCRCPTAGVKVPRATPDRVVRIRPGDRRHRRAASGEVGRAQDAYVGLLLEAPRLPRIAAGLRGGDRHPAGDPRRTLIRSAEIAIGGA